MKSTIAVDMSPNFCCTMRGIMSRKRKSIPPRNSCASRKPLLSTSILLNALNKNPSSIVSPKPLMMSTSFGKVSPLRRQT